MISLSYKNKICISSDVINELQSKITSRAFSFLLQISQFISNNNILRKNGSSIGKFYSISDIAEQLGMNYQNCCKCFNQLFKTDIVKKLTYQGHDCIVINPWVCHKNTTFDLCILQEFESSFWKKMYDGEDITQRNTYEYKKWMYLVQKRDSFQCQCCGRRSDLEVHHILPYSYYIDKRLDINNGITLCRNCHNSKVIGSFHNIYGTVNNTMEQLDEYLKKHNKNLDSIIHGITEETK